MEPLVFAQKFPFSQSAKEHLKKMNISPEDVPESAVKRAALMVSRAFSGGTFSLEGANPSTGALETELMAFPVAKMFVSVSKTPQMCEKLSMLVFRNTFSALANSSSPRELCLELADDFKLSYSLFDGKDFFASVPVLEFLRIHFVDNEMKLVNMPVISGRVFLNENSFARFLAELSYSKVLSTLPIAKENIPKKFHTLAQSLDSQLVAVEKKNFDFKLAGKVDAEIFPPCIKNLYIDSLAGKKLSYQARLTLYSFLYQVGMSKEDMLAVLSKSPDFDKRVSSYHLDRIIEKKLSAPSFGKIHEYGFKTKECEKEEGNFKHPVQYYISHLRAKNRIKNLKNQKKSSGGGV